MSFSVGFGPSHFSWIVLGFEMSVTFSLAESEYL